MPLSFTNIPDRDGPAVYIIGTRMLENDLQRFAGELNTAAQGVYQIVYLDVDSQDGAAVAQFYSVTHEELPAILIVMDDDTIYKSWFGQTLPRADELIYELNQITGSLGA